MLCFEGGEELESGKASFISDEHMKHLSSHPRNIVFSDKTSHSRVAIINSAEVANAHNTLLIKSVLKTARKALGECTAIRRAQGILIMLYASS